MSSVVAKAANTIANPLERRLITIASGKGGVGKTWFAITLTHALAAQGRKLLLFDGDLGLANVDIQLGLMPDRDLGDVISGRLSLDQAVIAYSDDSAEKHSFDVIAGKSGSGALGSLTRDALMRIKTTLIDSAKNYDHVVLDLAAGVEAGVTLLADHTGICLVVLTAEPTSLTDAYAFIKLRRMRNSAADIRIVVNQAKDRHDAESTYETIRKACASFLKYEPKYAGYVRRDAKVNDAIRRQTSMLSRHPQSDAAQDVETIAKGLLADLKRKG